MALGGILLHRDLRNKNKSDQITRIDFNILVKPGRRRIQLLQFFYDVLGDLVMINEVPINIYEADDFIVGKIFPCELVEHIFVVLDALDVLIITLKEISLKFGD